MAQEKNPEIQFETIIISKTNVTLLICLYFKCTLFQLNKHYFLQKNSGDYILNNVLLGEVPV
jgi:hypothetical protein